jgi:hypothetical protein
MPPFPPPLPRLESLHLQWMEVTPPGNINSMSSCQEEITMQDTLLDYFILGHRVLCRSNVLHDRDKPLRVMRVALSLPRMVWRLRIWNAYTILGRGKCIVVSPKLGDGLELFTSPTKQDKHQALLLYPRWTYVKAQRGSVLQLQPLNRSTIPVNGNTWNKRRKLSGRSHNTR